ncbi:F-box only protein 41-like isoform X1 [Ptychodera flava]|uniref:F-box only protein 41-like isoform X1 n=1 Tax=Ptychodera flava TaxID=63121 RepID=UPI00396A26CF
MQPLSLPRSRMDREDTTVLLELPYRCPRCGENKRFSTLSALKTHLEYEHTYPSPEPFSSNGNFESPRGHKSAFRPWERFTAEAKELERQLAIAKETERRHKRERELGSDNLSYFSSNPDGFTSPVRTRSHEDLLINDRPHQSRQRKSLQDDGKHFEFIDKLQNDLRRKDKELEKAHEELQRLTSEKRQLQKENRELNKQLDSDLEYIAELKQQLQEKDKQLQEKNRTSDFMNSFLKLTAEKEAMAKEQLKSYIDNLSQRAETAENELKVFKTPGSIGPSLSRSDSINRSFPQEIQGSQPMTGQNPTLIRRPQSAPNPELHVYDFQRPSTAIPFMMDMPANRRHTVGVTPQQLQLIKQQQQSSAGNQPVRNSVENLLSHSHAGGYHPRRHTVGITPQQLNGIFHQQQLPSGQIAHSTPDLHTMPMTNQSSPMSHGLNRQRLSKPPKPNRRISYADSHINSNGSNLHNASIKSHPGPFLMQRPGTQSPGIRSLNGITPDRIQEEQIISQEQKQMKASPVQNGGMVTPNGYANGYGKHPDDDDIGLDMMEAAYNEIAKKNTERNSRQKQKLIQKEMERLERMNSHDNYDEDDDELSDTVTTVTDEDDDSDMDDNASQGELPHDLIEQTEQAALDEKRKRYRAALFCVFSYLETKTLIKVALVCKDWMEVSRHPALWKKVKLANHRISSKFLQRISKYCSEMQYLSLEGLRGRKIRAHESTQDYLDQQRGCLEGALELMLKTASNRLVTIRIADCSNIVTDRALWLASCHCRNLQNIMYISESDPVGHEVIWALGAGCRNILSFQVPPMYPCLKPHRFNNRCMQMIGRCWPLLRALSVGGIDVDAKGLVSVVKNCPRLQVLEVDHMLEITEEIAVSMCQNGLRGLENLIFTATPVTPKALLQFNSSCPQLNAININVGISDYFAQPQKQSNIDEYNKVIAKLKSLQKRPAMMNLLHIRADYG